MRLEQCCGTPEEAFGVVVGAAQGEQRALQGHDGAFDVAAALADQRQREMDVLPGATQLAELEQEGRQPVVGKGQGTLDAGTISQRQRLVVGGERPARVAGLLFHPCQVRERDCLQVGALHDPGRDLAREHGRCLLQAGVGLVEVTAFDQQDPQ